MQLKIDEIEVIARNLEFRFCIGKFGDRWLGVAIGAPIIRLERAVFGLPGPAIEDSYMHVFPEVSEGGKLGMTDKNRAMLLVGALAQDPEQGFGDITGWLVPEDLRGDPDAFRCKKCGEVGCDGTECEDDFGETDLSDVEGEGG